MTKGAETGRELTRFEDERLLREANARRAYLDSLDVEEVLVDDDYCLPIERFKIPSDYLN